MTSVPSKLSDTDWSAVVWSIFPSLGIAAALVALALEKASEAPIDWMACITFLVALELVKIFVSRALEDTYLQHQDVPGAIRYFLKIMLGGSLGWPSDSRSSSSSLAFKNLWRRSLIRE
jgi:hypothetical protein